MEALLAQLPTQQEVLQGLILTSLMGIAIIVVLKGLRALARFLGALVGDFKDGMDDR